MHTVNSGPVPERQTLSIPEAAVILGIGRNATYEAVKRGEIHAIRIGGRILVPRREIEYMLTGDTIRP